MIEDGTDRRPAGGAGRTYDVVRKHLGLVQRPRFPKGVPGRMEQHSTGRISLLTDPHSRGGAKPSPLFGPFPGTRFRARRGGFIPFQIRFPALRHNYFIRLFGNSSRSAYLCPILRERRNRVANDYLSTHNITT